VVDIKYTTLWGVTPCHIPIYLEVTSLKNLLSGSVGSVHMLMRIRRPIIDEGRPEKSGLRKACKIGYDTDHAVSHSLNESDTACLTPYRWIEEIVRTRESLEDFAVRTCSMIGHIRMNFDRIEELFIRLIPLLPSIDREAAEYVEVNVLLVFCRKLVDDRK
jgi:hypothetical protein